MLLFFVLVININWFECHTFSLQWSRRKKNDAPRLLPSATNQIPASISVLRASIGEFSNTTAAPLPWRNRAIAIVILCGGVFNSGRRHGRGNGGWDSCVWGLWSGRSVRVRCGYVLWFHSGGDLWWGPWSRALVPVRRKLPSFSWVISSFTSLVFVRCF